MGSYMGFMSNTRGVALNVSITHVPNLHEDSGCLWSVFARTSSIAFAFLPRHSFQKRRVPTTSNAEPAHYDRMWVRRNQ
jgi:hypothetical protein